MVFKTCLQWWATKGVVSYYITIFLYFQEIDPEVFDENEIESELPGSEGGIQGLAKELLQDVASSLPGIDEAKSFIQVMGYVCMLPIQ